MALVKVCSVEDLQHRGMTAKYLMAEGVEVLVARDASGKVHAINGTCPHEDSPLVDGAFDGKVVTCAAHGWSIDVTTGKGVNPSSCSVECYRVCIQDDQVWVDLAP
jgi:toluene monooxygenase system ferredoxin subunit